MFTAYHANITGSIHSCYCTQILSEQVMHVSFQIQSTVSDTVGRTQLCNTVITLVTNTTSIITDTQVLAFQKPWEAT